VPTTLPFHDLIMAHPKFQEGDVDTGFIVKYADDLTEPEEPAIPNPNASIVARAVKKKGKR
jgi:acetyl/propionyl-CoA carboxylase alpha subunit